MKAEPDYRDSVARLDLKITEIAEREDKPKLVVRTNLLCEILNLEPGKSGNDSHRIIREAIAPKCLEKNILPDYFEHRLLCEHFNIPVYHQPKKDTLLRFKILKLFTESYPTTYSSRELAKLFGKKTGKIADIFKQNTDSPWFKRIEEKDGCCTYKWTVTEAGINAYHNDMKTLKTFSYKRKKVIKNKYVRRKNPLCFKILELFYQDQYTPAYTKRMISDMLSIRFTKVDAALYRDLKSSNPYFKHVKKINHNTYRYMPTDEGYRAYIEWKRNEVR